MEKPLGVPVPLPLSVRTFKNINDRFESHVLVGDHPVAAAATADRQESEDAAINQFVRALRVAVQEWK